MEEFRRAGITVAESFGRDSIKAQLRVADRIGAEWVLILGQKEALDGSIILREMSSGAQEIVPQEKIIEIVKKRLAAK
jgi:histidyl-tRNA synthetase